MADEDPYKGYTREEIQDAFRIAREDGMHIMKAFARLNSGKKTEEVKTDVKTEEVKTDVKTEEPETEGTIPPVKEEGKTETPKKRSLWWGDRA